MKKNIFLTIISVLALGIGVAVFAYNTTARGTDEKTSCCPKGHDSCPMKMKMSGDTGMAMNHDSCPMKSKDASATEKASCCDNCDCCKGDSCPMKHKGEASATAGTATDKKADGTTCDCSCCNHDKGAKTDA